MSDHKNFSKALDAVVRHIVHNTKIKQIPSEIDYLRRNAILYSNQFISSYGIMGSTEELRKISEYEYELQINMELPFGITPVRDDERRGSVKLIADDGVEHPAVVDGYIERGALKNWIYSTLQNMAGVDFSDFKRTYIIRKGGFKLKLLPVLEFDYCKWPLPDPALPKSSLQACPWYAVSEGTAPLSEQSFQAWAPDWERCMLEANPNYQKVQILMDRLLSANHTIFVNTKAVIETTMLHATLDKGLPPDLADCLIETMERLIGHLKEDTLIKAFTDNVNLFRSISGDSIELFYKTAVDLVSQLKKLKAEALTFESGENRQPKSVACLISDLKLLLKY